MVVNRASEINSVDESEVENPQMGEEDYGQFLLVNDEISDGSEEELSIGEDSPMVMVSPKI